MEAAYDVIVVGAGNAGLCAALAARETGASVLVLERAPFAERGGNSAFTAGAMRTVYSGLADIQTLVPDLSEDQVACTDFGSYSDAQFLDDISRVTENRCDPDLTSTLVSRSFDTLKWMRSKGVRFLPLYGRQAFEVDGRFKFWGGLTLEAVGGGQGLVDSLTDAARAAGIDIAYDTRGTQLLTSGVRVIGVSIQHDGLRADIKAGGVILAAGGFQSNVEWRARYLGPNWDLAKVRGTRFNTGDGIRMALDIGAIPWGHWSGAHAVAWEYNAPPFGDLAVGDGFQKHSYPFSVMVNAHGERFLDEGADFRNYTYAKYGHVILQQPHQFCWQIFDRKVEHLLRDEYRIRQVTKVTAPTLEELAVKLEGVDSERFLQTISRYNQAVDKNIPFDPNVKDGRRTNGLPFDKTNWAQTLDTPPYSAYQVTCGVTFTYGGLRITTEAEVVNDSGNVIPGLYACGELVGGIFYFNYPGGSGLTNGAVFGRIAGNNAGVLAAERTARQPHQTAV